MDGSKVRCKRVCRKYQVINWACLLDENCRLRELEAHDSFQVFENIKNQKIQTNIYSKKKSQTLKKCF